MVLSIGMIVKNEEKYLEQCLTALKPILDKLDSELIIADTGSTDRTVEIAKKFTDNVFHFEWIDDFAAARNSTLERAQGDWYMFIDADEILQDCSDLIKFFKTGEFKKYKAATYTVRSYHDLSARNSYFDIRSQRLIAREYGIEFRGKVHEIFSRVRPPIKMLNLIADHYGYVFFDNGIATGLAEEKSQRNLDYLFKELEDENIAVRNPNIYNEISDCYGGMNNREKELEYLNLGLEKISHETIVIAQYYSHKVLRLLDDLKYNEVIETANEYFDVEKHPWHNKELASDCSVYYACACAHYSLKEYKNAISDAAKFFDLLKKYKQNKLNTDDLMYATFRVGVKMTRIGYNILFHSCCEEEQYALADSYTNAIPLNEYLDNAEFTREHLKMRIAIMENVGYNKLDALYRQLDEHWRNFLLSLVRPRVFKADPKKRGMIVKKLASFDGAPSELARIYSRYFENNTVDFEMVKSFLEKYGSENSEDMLLILMLQNLDITPFVQTRDFFPDRAVQLSLMNYDELLKAFEDYDVAVISGEGLEASVNLYYCLLRRAAERNLTLSKAFEKLGELGARWHDVAQSNRVSTYLAAALLAHDVVEAREKRDLTQFRKAVDELKRVVPDMIPPANAYEKENRDVFKTVSGNSEFEQLAIQVKRNIRDLIAAGSIGEARKLIKEYEGICPNDPETEALKDEINNALQ